LIRKMRKRYFILISVLLGSTLILGLAILFGFLYHSEISSTYTVMQEIIDERPFPSEPNRGYKERYTPQINTDGDNITEMPLLHENSEIVRIQQTDEQYFDWNPYDPFNPFSPYNPYNPYNPFNPFNPYNPFNPFNPQPPQADDENKPGKDQHNDDSRPDEKPQATKPTTEAPPVTKPAPPVTSARSETSYSLSKKEPHDRPETRYSSATGSSYSEITTESASATTYTTVKTTIESVHKTTTGSLTTHSSMTTMIPETTSQIVPVEEGAYVPDAIIAEFDSDGNLSNFSENNREVDKDDSFKRIHHAISEIRRSGRKSGIMQIEGNSYRYLYKPVEMGYFRLVLLDRAAEKDTIQHMISVFLIISAAGLIIVFVSSSLLSRWIVVPVEAAWEKQKQFVADASHELKTPLAVISANTEVILSSPQELVAEQSKWLNYIQSETMRMSKLVTSLLSAARMDNKATTGNQNPELALSDIVSSVCLVFEPIIYENQKKLETEIQSDIYIQAEEDNIKQLLSILLDNAVLHSVPQARITVVLSKNAQDKVQLSISNTANDIPSEQLEHLFDRYYRLDKDGSPNGSGLGLSIARSIVRQLGGKLTVTSENKIVTFHVEF